MYNSADRRTPPTAAGEKGLQNRMNGEDWQREGDVGAKGDDNVVRLTDWLGPREDLIPFGPRSEAGEPTGAESPPSDADSPPSAADFWSETSAAVQDALTAPHHGNAPARAGESSGPIRVTRRSRKSAAALWGRRRAAMPAARTAIVVRRRAWPAVTASVVTAVLLAGIFVVGSGSGTHSVGRLSALSDGGRNVADAGTLAMALGSPEHHLNPLHLAGRRSGAHRAAGPRSRGSRGGQRGRGGPAVVVTREAVRYTAPAATSSSSTPAPTTPRYATAGSTAPSTSSANQPSGSSSQPALGADGSLAPGSSPDG